MDFPTLAVKNLKMKKKNSHSPLGVLMRPSKSIYQDRKKRKKKKNNLNVIRSQVMGVGEQKSFKNVISCSSWISFFFFFFSTEENFLSCYCPFLGPPRPRMCFYTFGRASIKRRWNRSREKKTNFQIIEWFHGSLLACVPLLLRYGTENLFINSRKQQGRLLYRQERERESVSCSGLDPGNK